MMHKKDASVLQIIRCDASCIWRRFLGGFINLDREYLVGIVDSSGAARVRAG